MKTKNVLTIFLLLIGHLVQANMSSPFLYGTKASSAFTSKDINILSESIYIKIDKDYNTAKFIVEYTIQSDVVGKQIPLLFFAKDYKDDFFVWVDNKKVNIKNIPDKYIHFENSPFAGFKNTVSNYTLNELKYFETDISKGIHKVRVEYIALVSEDNSDWITKYSFRYSLAPAKFWKSFGSLNITLEQEGIVKQLSTNIGVPIEKIFKASNSWSFNKLPDDYLEFSYTPQANTLAKILITIDPFGLAIIAGVILFLLHLFFVNLYRKKFTNKKYSLVVILGSLIIPFLILLAYMYSFGIIDNVIGKDAARHHGYVFFVIVLYPIILPIYWSILWLFDRRQKRKLINEKGSR